MTSKDLSQGAADLVASFRAKSDSAYCNYILQHQRDTCLGSEYKLKHGKFTQDNLDAFMRAAELLGRHKAFAEAANALSSAPCALPVEEAGNGLTFDEWLEHPYTKVLTKSIAEDYVPRAPAQAAYFEASQAIAEPEEGAGQVEAPALSEAESAAYDLIDRFLRNNLDDDDYAEFSAALEVVLSATPPVIQSQGGAT